MITIPNQDKPQPSIIKQDPKHSHPPSEVRKKIQNYSFLLTDRIGKGYSSIVYRGINDLTGKEVAIKVIQLRSLRDLTSKHMLQTEIQCFKETNHPNLLHYENSFFTMNNCYIVTEYCSAGDLARSIKETGGMSQNRAGALFLQIFRGYQHFLNAGFIHRDLKPANIFVTVNGTLKIADFGFSKRRTLAERDNYNVGTPIYMPRESLTANIYNQKTDIWALGVTLYQMLFACVPFRGQTEPQLRAEIERGHLVFPDHRPITYELKNFIACCLHPEAFRRISVKEIPHHPWIKRMMKDEGEEEHRHRPEQEQQEKEIRISLPNDGMPLNSSKNYFQKPILLDNRRSVSSMQKLKLCHPRKGSQAQLPARMPLVNRSVGAINLTVPYRKEETLSKDRKKQRENSSNKQNQGGNKENQQKNIENQQKNKENISTNNRASVSLSTMPSQPKEGERRMKRGIEKIVSLINYFRLLFKISQKIGQTIKEVLDGDIRSHLTRLHSTVLSDLRSNFQMHLDSLASGDNHFALNSLFWADFVGSDRWSTYSFVIKRYQNKYQSVLKEVNGKNTGEGWRKRFLQFYSRVKQMENSKVLLVGERYLLCEVSYLLETLVEMEQVVIQKGWDQFTERYCGNEEFVPEGFSISMANYYEVQECVHRRYSKMCHPR